MTDIKIRSENAKADDASSASTPYPTGTWRWAMLALPVIGCIAGAVGSEVIYQTRELFEIAPERVGIPPHPPAIEREILAYTLTNHAIGFGSLGLFLCGGLGLALGAFRASAGGAVRGLLAGCVLGPVCGAGGGMAALLLYDALAGIPVDGLFKAMLIHLPNWLLLGLATALAGAAALQSRQLTRFLFPSLIVAGILAAMLFPILGLVVFPAAAPDRPIPFDLGLRVLCFAVGGAALGFGAAYSLRSLARNAA